MAVNLLPAHDLLPVAGVELASGPAGIRYKGRDDLVLVHFAPGTQVAAAFTRNAFCAAPVSLCRQRLAAGKPIRGVLLNAGNANAGTGSAGMQAAVQSCELAAEVLQVGSDSVLPLSTGVIGQLLPVEPFRAALPKLQAELAQDGWLRAAKAMMTTDTVSKGFSRQIELAGRLITITGIAKGAGMIRPDMATMLSLVATDAAVERQALQSILDSALAGSFNAISVDGDTSTNDALIVAASGAAGGAAINVDSAEFPLLQQAVAEVCQYLAHACVRDAEGATRFIAVEVSGARDVAEARKVAYTVAESPLVKTAAFAGDPNWGRILAAVGRSGVPDLDISGIDLFLDRVCLIRGGEPDPSYAEARGAAVAKQAEFSIAIGLGRGNSHATVWTCDYSYDYIKINAEYRS